MEQKPHPDAVLREVDGLEFWDWREACPCECVCDGDDTVRKIELTGKGVYTDYEADGFAGKFVNEDHYAVILDENADVYRPRGDDLVEMFGGEESPEDRLLISFRKRVIPKELMDSAWDNLLSSAWISDNRGMAAGPIDERFVRSNAQDGKIRYLGPNRAKYILPDGTLGAVTIANKVRSGIIGHFDASPRFPYCRQTGWDTSNLEMNTAITTYLEAVNACFKRQAPVRWQRQKDFVDSTGIYRKGWTLGDTVFTTVTVNKDWQTAVHKDAGDFPQGYGNLTAVERRPYKGGYTGFPKFRVAANVRTGDFLAMNVHEWHGNTRMIPLDPHPEGGEWAEPLDPQGDHGFDRLSFVCYARWNMKDCGTKEEEAANQKEWKQGFMPSKTHAIFNMRAKQAHADEAAEEVAYLKSIVEGE